MNLATLQTACLAARRALPLIPASERREEIERAVVRLERTANAADEDQFRKDLEAAAEAFASDMRPVCAAAAFALKQGDLAALAQLRRMLPKLLARANRRSRLVGVLVGQLGRGLALGWHGKDIEAREATANAAETGALRQWRGRTIFPTGMSSAQIRNLSSELRLRSVFSARMTNAKAVQELADVVDSMLSGEINLATGRLRMMRKLAQLGYDPAKGFPDDWGKIPPAERGSLRDLSSEKRIDLMLETNQRMAANYGRMTAGNEPYARHAYPAWELTRIYWRRIPRGTSESHSDAWGLRWEAAGASVEWAGAMREPMIARKDSPLWQALGDGAGGYTDTLGNPFPPFAFNSGLGWREVSREECERRNVIGADEETGAMRGHLSPGQKEVKEALDELGPDFKKELLAELEGLAA